MKCLILFLFSSTAWAGTFECYPLTKTTSRAAEVKRETIEGEKFILKTYGKKSFIDMDKAESKNSDNSIIFKSQNREVKILLPKVNIMNKDMYDYYEMSSEGKSAVVYHGLCEEK